MTRHLTAREKLLLERESDEAARDARSGDPELPGSMAESRRIASAALVLLLAALVVYFAFNAGGFFAGPPAFVAVILCVALTLRVTLAEGPFEGVNWRIVVAVVAMSLFTLETLLSRGWSHAPGVALTEFDYPLVYLLVMVLFGSVAHRGARLAWMLRALASGIVVVCGCALTTRLLPHLWPTSPDIANNRLSYPLTYWNALGLLAALGAVLCLHFASDTRERRIVRVIAAAAIPVLACTLYFTFSRGGIAAALVAVVVYVLLGRPRGLLSVAIAELPATGVALVVAYHANLLATLDPTTPGAVSQGHRVALVLVACIVGAALLRIVLLPLDRHFAQFEFPLPVRRHSWVGWGCLVAVVLVAAGVLHRTISDQYRRFVNPASITNNADLRARLTDPANNGRIYTWRVAWHGFESDPWLGHGAGTFVDTWEQRRPTSFFVQDAHSLYLETLDELGITGLLLLLVVILTVLWGAARRVRGSRRPLYAATFAVLLAWALHAGIDWDWEMPALSVIFFGLGGAGLARRRVPSPTRSASEEGARMTSSPARPRSRRRDSSRRSRSLSWQPSSGSRAFLGIGCLLLSVSPAYVWLAQRKLDAASNAFNAGNCSAATSAAVSSISIVGVNARPYEVLGYCDISRNLPNAALTAINKAVSLDPHNSDYVVDLAVIRAAAGLNPLLAARRAVSLNPKDPDVQAVWLKFRSAPSSEWQREGRQFIVQFTSL